jgi:ABC-type phosphate transport system substrate-binding protein
MAIFYSLTLWIFVQLAVVPSPALASLDVLFGALGGGGASFPDAVYQDINFDYKLSSSVDVYYTATGSSAGKCNIMGYWHTGNLNPGIPSANKTVDTNICSDTCTTAICGFNQADRSRTSTQSKPNQDTLSRIPLLDFVGSDSLLKSSDYAAFPDLQMFPALAGGCVPIYNIPELKNVIKPLILSRNTIAQIFLGNIRVWNDSAILADNANEPTVLSALSNLNKNIQIVVRTDGSGTTEIFSSALASFSPINTAISPDYSFQKTVTAGEKPFWCGTFTDEVQTMTITGVCDSTVADKTVVIQVVDVDYNLKIITFACDADVATIKPLIVTAMKNQNVALNLISSTSNARVFRIGYLAALDNSSKVPRNWYTPSVVSQPIGIKVTFGTIQEGSYKNSHYSYSSIPKLPEIQSLWVNNAILGGSEFTLGYVGVSGDTQRKYFCSFQNLLKV